MARRQASPPLDTATFRAFRRGVQLAKDNNPNGGHCTAANLGLSDPALERMLTGVDPRPRQGDRVMLALATFLCRRATAVPAKRAARFNRAAQALGADVYRAAFRAAERDAEDASMSRGRSGKLAIGIVVAPFLSESGRPLLAMVMGSSRLGTLVEVTAAEGMYNDADDKDDDPDVKDFADWLMESSADVYEHYEHELLPEGVHHLPWTPWSGKGWVLVAIDSEHRLVARVDVPDGTRGGDIDACVAARKDLLAAIEAAAVLRTAAASYSDGYGTTCNGDDDGRDDLGEEWKRGAKP